MSSDHLGTRHNASPPTYPTGVIPPRFVASIEACLGQSYIGHPGWPRRGWQPIWGGNELNSKGLFRGTNTDIPIDTPADLSLSVAFSGPRKRWKSSDGRTSLLSCLQGFSFAVELVRAPKLSRIQLSCMCPSSCIEPPWQAPYEVAAAPAGRTSS